jgi:hypothetical protein
MPNTMDLKAAEKLLVYQLPCELNYTITSVSRKMNKCTKLSKPELNFLFEIVYDKLQQAYEWYVKNNLPQTMPRNTIQY